MADNSFSLPLPDGFLRDDVFGLFGRDADGRTERIEGECLTKALLLAGRPSRMELRFAARQVEVSVHTTGRCTKSMRSEACTKVTRMLGVLQDPGPFENLVLKSKELAPLIANKRGLRIPQTVNVFEALVWVIVGQQVNLTFAGTCRSRLIGRSGQAAGDGFVAHPTPEEVASLEYSDLVELQFSRRKAEYMIDTARQIASGELDLVALETASDEEARERLIRVRGLGPWSINYLLLRALGREDCVPVGDAGLVVALQRFFGLEARPDAKETLRLMEVFAPYRSFATFHLWKSLDSSG